MKIRSTTILTVRHRGQVAMGGDGQVTMGQTVVKADAVKIRKLMDDSVLVGCAGAAADAFALLERRLEVLGAVVDRQNTLLLSGTGYVIQPSDGVLGIGSGGNYALAAAQALIAHSDLSAAEITRRSLEIAGDICVYSNRNLVVETLD